MSATDYIQSSGMGLGGIKAPCWRRKCRWYFYIDGIADPINALPPQKSARPSLNVKEFQVEHLTETIYFPAKPDWKPVSLVLYDSKKSGNPVFDWLKILYDPDKGNWGSNGIKGNANGSGWKKKATLDMLDSCGNILETWVYENAWPNSIEWGDLDMASSEIVMVDLTLRYDRAYIK